MIEQEKIASIEEKKQLLAALPKAYEPQAVEGKWYRFWEEGGYFKPRPNPQRPPFVISMPPPNVTGVLHVGHALTATIEDIMIRYHRMRGDETLWVPGEDHAGIATQAVVERELAKEGTDRHRLGRAAFLERVWQWVGQYKKRIQNQHRRLGVSCDWSRQRFTLDEGLSRAVREVFVRLYEEGLIYRGERIINWCPRCMSAISDLEVEHEDTPGKLTYVRYPLKPEAGSNAGTTEYISVATTRPETILGDTAVAVNPRDERYRALVGRTAILPVIGREIPIIADEAVEMGFGTGAVKVTPFHDPTDFEIGQRHGLPRVQVIGFDGKMTPEAGPYAGLDRFEARKKLVEQLQQEGLIVKIEDYTVPLGHCQRCNTVIEPLVSKQWFVHMKPLATPALNAVKYGQIRILPERFTKIYCDWLENIHDWTISRQLWWGHRIPVWYCDDCGETIASREDVTRCPHCESERLHQDEDVLDTWFSSWLWPFSTLGWPDDTPDLRRYYPTSVMETGYDIIFFWVARMVMAGIHFMGTIPFRVIYLHGLVRDAKGEKMSKSKNNVVDPIEVMDQYGTDALRFTLATSSTPGNDMKLVPERIVGNRNFANKIWNASRFVLTATAEIEDGVPPLEALRPRTLADRWIVSRISQLISDVTQLIEEFQFGEAGRRIHEFFWTEYCDWYLEIAKVQLQGDAKARKTTAAILRAVLDTSLRLLHPFMPFVTEEVWQHLYRFSEPEPERWPAPALIVAPWPQAVPAAKDEEAEEDFALLQELITRIRDARNQLGVEPARRIQVLLAAGPKLALLSEQAPLIEFLARTETPRFYERLEPKPQGAMGLLAGPVEIYLPLAGMFDVEKELARLDKEIARTEQEITRFQARLANEEFVKRAKPEVVERERERLSEQEERLAKLRERRAALSS
ncbi:MAG: valine--tRNA ligase [Thermogemmatispora sp.]|jgi:valyl-tRNA synthetase|uniref:valine--tRNA ligase n=1 Tax=Thermogemmatispora sp. TaxID=1968838 RepID=UPI0019F28ADC|nr:valine--tRNA ligase [Thermogemmatispora sp.]MBE3565229.1 valine--tRNA ligase [Thermogemmatispora sp.]